VEDAIRPESTDEVTSAPGGAATRVYASELDGAHVLTDAVASYGAAPSGGLLSVKRDGAVVREVHIPSAGPHQIIFDPPLMGTTNEYLTVALGGGGGVVVGKLAVGHYVKPASGRNRVKNPGFEMAGEGGADIWANWIETVVTGAIADETVNVHSGGHACKITAGATWFDTTNRLDTFAVIPGTKQTFTFWTRGDGIHDGYYQFTDVTHSIVLQAGLTGVPGTTYQQVTKTITIPAGCFAVWVVFIGSQTPGGIAYFDDVSVVLVG